MQVDGDSMVVNGDRIRVLAERDPAKLPWGELGVEYVLECTGLFTSKAKAGAHLKGGAKKVVISAPGGEDVDATIVYGVNHEVLKSSYTVISNASCTTNCLAPVAKVLHDRRRHRRRHHDHDPRLHQRPGAHRRLPHGPAARALGHACRMIPTKTGAAAAVGLVLPELKGKLDGFAVRVPTINVSLVDLTFNARARDHRRGDQRRAEARRPAGRSRESSPTTMRRWYRSTSTTTRTPRSSTPR